jgi:small subunit ribosomal protein S16
MVVIRLTRGGAKKRPFYHIVAAHKQSRRDGQFIERLGYYNPIAAGNETPLRVAVDRVDFWKQQGAALSPTVARLVKHYADSQATPPTATEPAAA